MATTNYGHSHIHSHTRDRMGISAGQHGVCVTCRNGGITANCPRATKVNINISDSQWQWRTWQRHVKSLAWRTVRMSNVLPRRCCKTVIRPDIPLKRVIHNNWPFHSTIFFWSRLVNCCLWGFVGLVYFPDLICRRSVSASASKIAKRLRSKTVDALARRTKGNR